MQSMCATDTACVFISVIQFYQPPPEGKGGCEGGESSHLGDNLENGPGAGLRATYTVCSHGKPARQFLPHFKHIVTTSKSSARFSL